MLHLPVRRILDNFSNRSTSISQHHAFTHRRDAFEYRAIANNSSFLVLFDSTETVRFEEFLLFIFINWIVNLLKDVVTFKLKRLNISSYLWF